MRKMKVKSPEKETATTASEEDQESSLRGVPSAGTGGARAQGRGLGGTGEGRGCAGGGPARAGLTGCGGRRGSRGLRQGARGGSGDPGTTVPPLRGQDGWGAQEGTLPAACVGGDGAQSPQTQGGSGTRWRGGCFGSGSRAPLAPGFAPRRVRRQQPPWRRRPEAGRCCGGRGAGPQRRSRAGPCPVLPMELRGETPRGRVCWRCASAAGSPQPRSHPHRQLCPAPSRLQAPLGEPQPQLLPPSPPPAPEPRPPGTGMGTLPLPAGHRTLQAPAPPKPGTHRPAPACAMAAGPRGAAGSAVAAVVAVAPLPVPTRPPPAAATLQFCPEPARTTGAIVAGGSRKATALPAEPASPGTRTQPRSAQRGTLPAGHQGWDGCPALTPSPAQPNPPPHPKPPSGATVPPQAAERGAEPLQDAHGTRAAPTRGPRRIAPSPAPRPDRAAPPLPPALGLPTALPAPACPWERHLKGTEGQGQGPAAALAGASTARLLPGTGRPGSRHGGEQMHRPRVLWHSPGHAKLFSGKGAQEPSSKAGGCKAEPGRSRGWRSPSFQLVSMVNTLCTANVTIFPG